MSHNIEAALGVAVYGAVFFIYFFVPVLRVWLSGKVKDDLEDLSEGVKKEAAREENVLSARTVVKRSFDPEAERLGDLYAAWLSKALELDNATEDALEKALKEAYGKATVIDADLAGERVVLKDSPDGTDPWWMVLLGPSTFVLPRPSSWGAFAARSTLLFEGEDVVPAAVKRVVAARIEETDGGAFRIKTPGLLSESVREAAIETDAEVRRLPALESERYASALVKEAVLQIDAAYPGGDYRRFDLLRLPTHADYTERMGLARNMAGLFVLVGLGLTMVRLNGVVGGISGAAASPNMSPDAFISMMGQLMGGIGGAFTSSIWGLGAMLIALITLSFLDRIMQQRFARLEHVVSDDVLPVLVQIQQRDMPTATLPAVLRATQKNIERLDETVQGLTTGMAASLEGMGSRITDLLQQLGTYERRSADLDRMLRDVAGTASSLGSVVAKLDAAAATLLNPLDRMRDQIADPLNAMVNAVNSIETGYTGVANELRALHTHLDETTKRTEALMEGAQKQQDEQLKAIGGHLQGFREGARELGPVAQKFAQAATAQVSAVRELQTTAQRLSSTGQVLNRAAEQFHRHGPAVVPPSLFAWFYNGMMSGFERMSGRRAGGWSRFDGRPSSGDGAPTTAAGLESAGAARNQAVLQAVSAGTMPVLSAEVTTNVAPAATAGMAEPTSADANQEG